MSILDGWAMALDIDFFCWKVYIYVCFYENRAVGGGPEDKRQERLSL